MSKTNSSSVSQIADQRDFDELEAALQQNGVNGALNFLEQKFRQLHQFPQLFEVLKMRCRSNLGLPLVYESSAELRLDEAGQRQLEEGLLHACLEVGLLIWDQGDLEKGWMYLQAVGNRPEVIAALERFPIDEENLDSVIEIAISQGLAPVYGYRLLLQKYGTCNAITSFDMQAARFDHSIQLQMAQTLLHHLYDELRRNIIYALQQQSADSIANPPRESFEPQVSISELIQANPVASARHGHHIDATHLASVVRIARPVREAKDLKVALELTQYGLELHPDFHYPSPPPFEDTYLDHQKFYQAQLGIEVEAALQHFSDKSETVPTDRFGGVAYETLADLLIRLGRRDEAIKLLSEKVWGKLPPAGIITNVFVIPKSADERSQLESYFRDQLDLLSFAVSRLSSC